MNDCLFCRIVARQSPSDIVYEDDAVVAFKDIYPKAPVHLLIVPRRHIASLAEATDGRRRGARSLRGGRAPTGREHGLRRRRASGSG